MSSCSFRSHKEVVANPILMNNAYDHDRQGVHFWDYSIVSMEPRVFLTGTGSVMGMGVIWA